MMEFVEISIEKKPSRKEELEDFMNEDVSWDKIKVRDISN